MDDKVPTRIYLPADTDSADWRILEKNPSRDWSTGEPANNIEFTRTDHVVSTIRELGERMHMTNDLVEAIVEAVKGDC